MITNDLRHWLDYDVEASEPFSVDGLVSVKSYDPESSPPEEVLILEKAYEYGAEAVMFEAARNGKARTPLAFIFRADGSRSDDEFAELHRKLWSWGGVPLLYRKLPGVVQLFRCAHRPDFISKSGKLICKPVRTLLLTAAISADPWWDKDQLRNGTIWDDLDACKTLLSLNQSAHKGLIEAVKRLSDMLTAEEILPRKLRRKLLILSLLIAYLEQREVFEEGYLGKFLPGATEFFQVLGNGPALVNLLQALEDRFNGNVFSLSDSDRERLMNSQQLSRFSRLIEGREERNGQLTLWKLYSFKDLPVELISHIYQLFVKDTASSVYTPPFLVRLVLDETLNWHRLDRLREKGEVILDPACGSGIFLVESYKRLVLHWRSRNQWQKPTVKVLKELLDYIHGVDLEEGAVELAAFSLCLSLCDALEPEEIRSSIKLFPRLAGRTLHQSCFFSAKEQKLITARIGVVVGNPPFASGFSTPGAERSYKAYTKNAALPDKQLAYLFLHEAMEMVEPGGTLSMLQQYNFLYNQQSSEFRKSFISAWDVREVLDFVSVRGMFDKGDADTRIVVVIADAAPALPGRRILHATFRRTGRSNAEQGFDIDYYDLHWLPRELALSNDSIWRTNLFGGGRMLGLVNRLRSLRTLAQFAQDREWDFGEGFIEGDRGVTRSAEHIVGKPLLRSDALTVEGIDESAITVGPKKSYEGPRSARRFTPPMLLIRENMELQHAPWIKSYLTYTQRIVGFCGGADDGPEITELAQWIGLNKPALKVYAALISPSLFIQKATALQASDIFSLPYPDNQDLGLSANEEILVEDVLEHYRDLIRLGEKSRTMTMPGTSALPNFSSVYCRQINTIYRENPLRPLPAEQWPGMLCQPFSFGDGEVDWDGTEQLQEKVNGLLRDRSTDSLSISRICRIYDGNFIFLLKPDRMRFWLRSVALRDADETLADLRSQGY